MRENTIGIKQPAGISGKNIANRAHATTSTFWNKSTELLSLVLVNKFFFGNQNRYDTAMK